MEVIPDNEYMEIYDNEINNNRVPFNISNELMILHNG